MAVGETYIKDPADATGTAAQQAVYSNQDTQRMRARRIVIGEVRGRFRTTGISPRFAERLKQHGIELPAFF